MKGIYFDELSAANCVDAKQWVAAYILSAIREPVMTLFPAGAPRMFVNLPEAVRYSAVVAFGSDGRKV